MNLYWKGHRQRLKERFIETEGRGFADYELLELFLFLAIPRIDTKPIAKQLLEKFKNINEIFYANDMSLKDVPYIGENTIYIFKLVRTIISRIAKSSFTDREVLSSFHEVIAYCQTTMKNLIHEQFRILFLDVKNKLIADEVHQEGTTNKISVYVREIIKRSLELGASSIILVHNHPSGDPEPSTNDILITKSILEGGKIMNIEVIDHIIIGKHQYRSMKSMGIL